MRHLHIPVYGDPVQIKGPLYLLLGYHLQTLIAHKHILYGLIHPDHISVLIKRQFQGVAEILLVNGRNGKDT
jgi:hypothetical protein